MFLPQALGLCALKLRAVLQCATTIGDRLPRPSPRQAPPSTLTDHADASARRAADVTEHAATNVLRDCSEAVARLLELLEEVVVRRGELLLLLQVLSHAAALWSANDALLVVVAEAGLVEGVHAEEIDRGQVERVVARGAFGLLEDSWLRRERGDFRLRPVRERA